MANYENSKNAIIKQIEEYIEDHKHYQWFTVPKNIYEMDEVNLLSVKEIKDFSPLKEFKNLKKLIFGTTDCSMTIKDFKGIQEAQTLEFLTFMCKTKINKNITEISNLANLKSLGLYNLVQEVPPDFVKNSQHLESIYLSKHNFNSLSELPRSIKEISINIDAIEQLPEWNRVESVKKVNIGSNTCQFQNLDSFSCFPNIEIINLNAPKKLTDVSFVKQLHALKSIELNFAPVDNLVDFSNNQVIEEIKARGTNISDFKNMGVLSNMKTLYLEKSKLQHIEGIKSILPGLEKLWIWDTKVKDLSPLKGMTSLKEIDFTKLKPKSWEFISSLTGLETLDLCKTSFSDLTLLMDLPKLKHVRLAGSKVDQKSDEYLLFERLIEGRKGHLN